MKHIIEEINIYNPKKQGRFFEISTPEEFAQRKCEELNSSETARRYKHEYHYVINPKKVNGTPSELYQTTTLSISQGVESVTIAIYRK
jgi:hypothetical protein